MYRLSIFLWYKYSVKLLSPAIYLTCALKQLRSVSIWTKLTRYYVQCGFFCYFAHLSFSNANNIMVPYHTSHHTIESGSTKKRHDGFVNQMISTVNSLVVGFHEKLLLPELSALFTLLWGRTVVNATLLTRVLWRSKNKIMQLTYVCTCSDIFSGLLQKSLWYALSFSHFCYYSYFLHPNFLSALLLSGHESTICRPVW